MQFSLRYFPLALTTWHLKSSSISYSNLFIVRGRYKSRPALGLKLSLLEHIKLKANARH